MTRNLSGWGVTVLGATLAAAGVYAMSWGWDLILLERGWSLFIAGSVFLSGGIVTIALGRVVAHLARLGTAPPGAAAAAVPEAKPATAPQYRPVIATQEPTPSASEPPPVTRPVAPPAARPDPPPAARQEAPHAIRQEAPRKTEQSFDPPDFAAMLGGEPLMEQPTEVDRYSAGDATYVMMSDGSVEVRSAAGTQRYPSLAALRAEAESRQS